ncbi:MAG: hypothetical protein HOV94_19015 [Saccharothrix sp.]|nr:hypothetical protein [Saccharothrix sp.]
MSVNLTPRSVRALEEVLQHVGGNQTDMINRAVQVYAYLEDIVSRGGALYVREQDSEQLERIRFF